MVPKGSLCAHKFFLLIHSFKYTMYTAKCLCALAFLALHHGHFWHYIIVCPNLHSINAFGFVHCSSLLSLALAKFHNVHPSAPIPIYAMRKHVQGICIFTWSTSLLARGTAPLTDRRTTLAFTPFCLLFCNHGCFLFQASEAGQTPTVQGQFATP